VHVPLALGKRSLQLTEKECLLRKKRKKERNLTNKNNLIVEVNWKRI
jgi:hypothetical protein